jgi:hypothetical protein
MNNFAAAFAIYDYLQNKVNLYSGMAFLFLNKTQKLVVIELYGSLLSWKQNWSSYVRIPQGLRQ